MRDRSLRPSYERTVRKLLEHEADLIGALAADERAALAGFLARLERALA